MPRPGPGPSGPRRPIARAASRRVGEAGVLARIDGLASLPTVVLEILEMSDDPKTSVDQMELAVRRDPVVSGRLLKLANSSFFGSAAEVTTLSRAVVQLGFRTVRTLVLAASAGKIFSGEMRGYGYEELGLWKHSLAVALAGRTLVRELGLPREGADEVFVAGLLHDVGKLVLEPMLRAKPPPAGRPASEQATRHVTTEIERAATHFDHPEVGGRIAQRWKLPAATREVIEKHHAPDPAGEFARYVAVVHLSDAFVNEAHVGLPSETEVDPAPCDAALEVLGLGAGDADRLRESLKAQLDEILASCAQLAEG